MVRLKWRWADNHYDRLNQYQFYGDLINLDINCLSFDHPVGAGSSDCGTVRPSATAGLRLITSSNFVGCSIGRSMGLTLQDFVDEPRGAVGHLDPLDDGIAYGRSLLRLTRALVAERVRDLATAAE
jgi:hypothetical protein